MQRASDQRERPTTLSIPSPEFALSSGQRSSGSCVSSTSPPGSQGKGCLNEGQLHCTPQFRQVSSGTTPGGGGPHRFCASLAPPSVIPSPNHSNTSPSSPSFTRPSQTPPERRTTTGALSP